jgi:RNA polymerase sigma factor (sigma-70 family)
VTSTRESEWLREYAETGSPEAFAQLVERYIDVVYSAALRQVRDPHMADDVTQTVFLALVRRAKALRRETVLGSWLMVATRFVALDLLRAERRRKRHESTAALHANREIHQDEMWEKISPELDAALAELASKDRRVIVLRYLEGRSMREVAAITGTTAAGARQRVHRAIGRLQQFFEARGISISAAAIGPLIASRAVHPAPAALAPAIQAAASAPHAAAVVKGVVLAMTWTKAKLTAIAACGLLLASGAAVVTLARHGASGVTLADAGTAQARAITADRSKDAAWRERFDKVYHPEAGQLVKLVPRPFIPERDNYLVQEKLPADHGNAYLTFQWDGRLNLTSLATGKARLGDVLWDGMRLKPYQFDDPDGFLKTPLLCDAIVRSDGSTEQTLAALARAAVGHTVRGFRFVPVRVPRELIVVSGRLHLRPWPGSASDEIVLTDSPGPLPADKAADMHREIGTLAQLLDGLEFSADRKVVNDAQPDRTYLHWRVNRHVVCTNLDALLTNLASQTGLTFARQSRTALVWRITPEHSTAD